MIDLREPELFGEVHIPGSMNLPLSPNINRYGPWVIPYDEPIYLVGDVSTDERAMELVYRQFVRVGLDKVVGYLKGGITAWEFDQRPSMGVIQHNPDSLYFELQENSDLLVLDVRMEEEFESGHVPGSHRIMLGDLRQQADKLPDRWEAPIVTVCSSGYRSTLAASILKQIGYENVGHLAGGFSGWAESDYDVEKGAPKHKTPAVKST
jgi:hydroxyacylglutathione hydrolase